MGEKRLSITIGVDGLEARAAVAPGRALNLDELHLALDKAGVSCGLDEAACADLATRLADPDFEVSDELLASGVRPQPGANGELELKFEKGLQAGAARDDDSIDFLERDLLKPVKSGDHIATLRPPGDGVSGHGVDGMVIPAPSGKAYPIRLGAGVKREDGGARIFATCSGAIHFLERKLLEVVDHHLHKGNVDVDSGNLHMEGSLTVTGNVNPRLRVQATRDVQIKGMVDGGVVLAGGDVTISGGVVGADEGRVEAKGCVAIHHAQGARIFSEERIEVQTDSVSSDFHAREIRVGGRILGGEARAGHRIAVGEAGAPTGAGTLLSAGEVIQPLSDLAVMEGEMEGRQTGSAKRPGGAPSGDRAGAARGKPAGEEAAPVERKPEREHREVELDIELLESAEIEIAARAHPGVEVRFGTCSKHLEVARHSVRFRFRPDTDSILMDRVEDIDP